MRWWLVLMWATSACDVGEPAPSVRAADGIRTTRSPELAKRLEAGDKVRVLDVRTPAEFASGHIPGALNLPVDQLKGRLGEVAPGEEVYVICEGGARSKAASQTMAARGLLPVDVEDGMSGWRWKGFPTE